MDTTKMKNTLVGICSCTWNGDHRTQGIDCPVHREESASAPAGPRDRALTCSNERDAFEAWVKRVHRERWPNPGSVGEHVLPSGGYINTILQFMWSAWQSAVEWSLADDEAGRLREDITLDPSGFPQCDHRELVRSIAPKHAGEYVCDSCQSYFQITPRPHVETKNPP